MVPLIGPGFKPTERDEMGLWKEMERAEEEISGSNLLVQDPRLTGYLQGPDRHRRRPGGAGISASIWRASRCSTR